VTDEYFSFSQRDLRRIFAALRDHMPSSYFYEAM